MFEEVLDLGARRFRNVVEVLDVRPARILVRHREHLVVAAGLVGHVEHADRAHLDADAGEERVLEQHERVERIAVVGEGVLEEAVIDGVDEPGEEHAVEEDASGLVIDLVLVPAPARDLDDGIVRTHVVTP